MPIAGFSFRKISAERTEGTGTKINIENNVSVKNIEDIDIGLNKEGNKTLKFTFEFSAKFTPGFGEIILEGEVLYVGEEKKIKDILKEWKKDKKVNKDLFPEILNYLLTKSNVEAIILSKDVNLPSPVPLPKVNVK